MLRTLLLGVAATMLCPQLAGGQIRSSPMVPSDSVVLKVRTEEGRALSHSIVELAPAVSGSQTRVMADENGRAAFLRPSVDTARLRIRAIGYGTVNVLLRLDTIRAPFQIVLRPSPLLLTEVCTTSWDPAIELWLDTLSARDITRVAIRVRDGAFEESAVVTLPSWNHRVTFAGERAGTYDIEVRAPGFRMWRRSNVRVLKGKCHVVTKMFRVRLVPLR